MFIDDIKHENDKWINFDSSILKKKNLIKLGILKYGVNWKSLESGKCITVEDWKNNFPELLFVPEVVDIHKISKSNLTNILS